MHFTIYVGASQTLGMDLLEVDVNYRHLLPLAYLASPWQKPDSTQRYTQGYAQKTYSESQAVDRLVDFAHNPCFTLKQHQGHVVVMDDVFDPSKVDQNPTPLRDLVYDFNALVNESAQTLPVYLLINRNAAEKDLQKLPFLNLTDLQRLMEDILVTVSEAYYQDKFASSNRQETANRSGFLSSRFDDRPYLSFDVPWLLNNRGTLYDTKSFNDWLIVLNGFYEHRFTDNQEDEIVESFTEFERKKKGIVTINRDHTVGLAYYTGILNSMQLYQEFNSLSSTLSKQEYHGNPGTWVYKNEGESHLPDKARHLLEKIVHDFTTIRRHTTSRFLTALRYITPKAYLRYIHRVRQVAFL